MTLIPNSKHLFITISILLLSVLTVHAQNLDSLQLAAEQGNAEAQGRLGAMYANDEGVSENDVEACAWINLSAAHGFDLAIEFKSELAEWMTPIQIAEAQKLSTKLFRQVESANQ